jgi:alpha-tubulin suppressor-like RCC1 family protein
MADDGPKEGEVLFCGMTDWKMIGRGKTDNEDQYPNIIEPTRIATLKGISIAKVCGGSATSMCMVIATDGRVFTWGRNETGQLGLGDVDNRSAPTEVKALAGIKVVDGACGKSHTVVVTADGNAYAWGSNKHGQLGVGSIARTKPKEDDNRLAPVQCSVSACTAVSCGAEFTMWICGDDGRLLSAGLPQYGQLGHGTDGEYNMATSSVKLAYEAQPQPLVISALVGRKITKVASGHNHTIAVDAEGRFHTWGFGGYGRLGHKVQKDEWTPKMVEIQGGDRNLCPADCVVAAGQTTSWVTALMGQMYCFGRLKTTGDNTMYPVPFMDLQGWNLRSVACGATTYAACGEDQAITWGQGGGNGELGYGPDGPKSSANPKLVDSLGQKHVIQVACGVGHTLFLIKPVRRGGPAGVGAARGRPNTRRARWQEAHQRRAQEGSSGCQKREKVMTGLS